jgi:hypothetical protein
MYFKIFFLFILSYLNFSTISNSQVLPIDTIQYQGDPDDVINIVVLPDGYVEEALGKFKSDAQRLINDLFSKTPFLEYKQYFNVFLINAPSSESGASHPGNATDVSEPVFPVKSVNNRFGSTFDFVGIHRLLVPTKSFEIVNVLANNLPNYDQVLLLVNSEFYGGSGGQYATTSLHADASEIAIHELGHSFANLADEYYAGDQYAREGPNMSNNNNPATIRWKNWHGENDIGIFQHCCGGNSNLWYRPHNNCEMRFLNNSFCSVCAQQIVEVIHDLTNPILDYFPQKKNLYDTILPILLGAETLSPAPNTLKKTWFINDHFVANGTDSLPIHEELLAPGLNHILFQVEDTSALLRVDNHELKHINTLTWEITRTSTSTKLITSQEYSIKISPNPTNSHIIISLQNDIIKPLIIQIFDVTGIKILDHTLPYENNSIPLESFGAGNYIIKILSEGIPVFSDVIVKI